MTKKKGTVAAESGGEPAVHVEVDVARESARVEICAGGHQVVVEANRPLEAVANTALEMWRCTDSPGRAREVGAMGFRDEQCTSPLPDDLTMPDRLGYHVDAAATVRRARWGGFEQTLRDARRDR